MGKEADLEALVAEVEARDRRDSERAAAPLRPAGDAILLDNSALNEAQTLAAVLDAVHKKI